MSKNKDKLEQYGILMSYLQYENSTFWVRSNFFLLANTALLGFLITSLPDIHPPNNWARILIPFVGCITGFILSILWLFALKSGEWWIKRWHSLLIKIEPQAFGEISVFRGVLNSKSKLEYGSKLGARGINYFVCYLFFVLWGLSIIYCITAISLKIFCG